MRQAQLTSDVAARLTEEDSLRVLDRIARTVRGRPHEFDANGAPDEAVQGVYLPDRFDAFRFTESRIWGTSRDESDIPSVAFIALPGR